MLDMNVHKTQNNIYTGSEKLLKSYMLKVHREKEKEPYIFIILVSIR